MTPVTPDKNRAYVPLRYPQASLTRLSELEGIPRTGQRLVWVPFSGPEGTCLLQFTDAFYGLSPPAADCRQVWERPAAESVTLEVTESASTILYNPFWELTGPAGERTIMCAARRSIELSTEAPYHRESMLRMLMSFTFIIMAAGYAIFVAGNVAVLAGLALLSVSALASIAGVAIFAGVGVFFKKWVQPALVEAMAEAYSPIVYARPGPLQGGLIQWLGIFLVASSALQLYIKSGDRTPAMALVHVLCFAASVVFAIHARRTFANPRYPVAPSSILRLNAGSWGLLAQTIPKLVYFAFRGGALALILLTIGVLSPAIANLAGFDAPESNTIESIFVTVAVIAGLISSPLPQQDRVTLLAALIVPALFEPLVGAGASSFLQFVAVFGTSRYFDLRSGDLRPGSSRESLVRSLQLEAVLIFGSLAGLAIGIAAVGTSGNTVGEVLGGLIAGAIFLQSGANRRPAPNPGQDGASSAETSPKSPPELNPKPDAPALEGDEMPSQLRDKNP